MDAAGIIDALGGAAKVSQITGASRTAVCNWRHNGIPAKFWIALLDEAEVSGVADVTRESVAWRPSKAAAQHAEAGA